MTPAMRSIPPPLVVALVFIVGWEVLSLAVGGQIIASPGVTLARLLTMMMTSHFWLDVLETGHAFLLSVILSTVFGFALGILLGLNPLTSDVVEPLLVTFYSLPKVTLYPVVLLLFGLGMSAKVAFGVMHGLVPITLITRNAVRQIKPVHLRTAKVLHLGAPQMIRWVVGPAILPELIVGLRIGISLSLLGVIIGEMFASKRGLGFSAMNAMNLGDIPSILAIGVFISAIAIIVNIVLLKVEVRLR